MSTPFTPRSFPRASDLHAGRQPEHRHVPRTCCSCAKNIERIGDHVTNIAETLHYVLTGQMLDDDRPKADASSDA